MFWRPTALPIVPFGGVDQGFSTMRVTSPYGPRDGGFHGGLDIGNYRAGDIVTAIGPGQVIMASPQPNIPWSYPSPRDMASVWGVSYGGNVIVIRHSERWYSQYVHLSVMDVTQGDQVNVNQPIGKVGDTGSARGQAHIHFGIRDMTQALHTGFVDPWPLITASGDTLPDTSLEDDMQIKRIKGEAWKPKGSNGVFRATPARGASVVARVAAGTVVISLAEIGTAAEPPNDDWRLTRLSGKSLYMLRADWDPLVPGGDPAIDQALSDYLAGKAADCSAVIAERDALQAKLDRKNTALDGAAQAITAARNI